jgi:methanogenic corrinoid protein MtbC1
LSYSGRAPHAEFLERIVTSDVAGAGAEAQRLCGRHGLVAFYDDVVDTSFHALDERVRRRQLSLAQLYVAAASVQAAAATAYESVRWPDPRGGTIVVACAPGERHSFGARVAADAFALAGWRDVFLGAGQDADAIARAVDEHGAGALAISVTMSLHLDAVREAIGKARGLRSGLKVVVGGKAVRGVPSADLDADAVAGSAREARDVAITFRIEK